MKQNLTCCGVSCCGNVKIPLDAKVSQEEVKGLYNSLSPVYDIWGTLAEAKARNRAIELADIKEGQSILEVAVGTGLAFQEIVKRNTSGSNIGIDISEGMLGKAQQKLSHIDEVNYELRVGSAFEIPCPDNTFDTLINNYMFDLLSFEDMGKVLVEFQRVLEKEGKLVLVNMTEGERPGSRMYDRIYSKFPRIMGGCRGVKLEDELRAVGFDVVSREYYQQFLFPSEVILAKPRS